jgi:hypothetical protein
MWKVMNKITIKITPWVVWFTVIVLMMPGCKSVAPVLNELSIKGFSSRTITIDQPTLATKGDPSPTVEAYIGTTGGITVNGSAVTGSTEGPVDVSRSGCQFRGLTTGTGYDIIVIAKNKGGFSVKTLASIVPAMPTIDPASYQQIGTDEMGLLRWYLSVSDDPLDDFSKIRSYEDSQFYLSSYRYSLAFMTYFFAIEQYYKLPAYSELIKPRMDRLIQKMQEKQVWQYWAVRSKGVNFIEPLLNTPYPEEHDPVGKKNIMYSGHLGHMIGLYEMLYRDLKWDAPGSIVFKWNDDEQYVYDNFSLQKVMYDQMVNNSYNSIECEPNAVFAECNQHPILSFMLYDKVHGTSLAEARNLFLDFFLRNIFINPITHETCFMYLVKQKTTITQEFASFGNGLSLISVPLAWLGQIKINSSVSNGWNGAFMHAWEPALIERHYPYQKANHVIKPDSTTAYLKTEMLSDQCATPFFAMLAGEVGDADTRDKLVAWCKDYYKAEWEGGMLRFPVREDTYVNQSGDVFTPWPHALTGVLVAFAVANPQNGMLNLHNKPFTDQSFLAPKVTGVDFPNALLKRAIYDFEKEALIITTQGGAETPGGNTSLTITQLDPARKWKLFMDGAPQEEYLGVSSISVSVPLTAAHDLVLIAE